MTNPEAKLYIPRPTLFVFCGLPGSLRPDFSTELREQFVEDQVVAVNGEEYRREMTVDNQKIPSDELRSELVHDALFDLGTGASVVLEEVMFSNAASRTKHLAQVIRANVKVVTFNVDCDETVAYSRLAVLDKEGFYSGKDNAWRTNPMRSFDSTAKHLKLAKPNEPGVSAVVNIDGEDLTAYSVVQACFQLEETGVAFSGLRLVS